MKFNSPERRKPNGRQNKSAPPKPADLCSHKNIYCAIYRKWLGVHPYRARGKKGMQISLKSNFWVNFFLSLFVFRLYFVSVTFWLLLVGFPNWFIILSRISPLSFECCGWVFLKKVLSPQRNTQILMKYFNYFAINWENISQQHIQGDASQRFVLSGTEFSFCLPATCARSPLSCS